MSAAPWRRSRCWSSGSGWSTSPRDTVGQLAGLSDDVALAVISAPQSGSVSRPTGSYAEAMSATWARLVEVPFAGLDFSDVRWALGRPPAEAVQTRR